VTDLATPTRPHVEYVGQPIRLTYCATCARYFHRAHDCVLWARGAAVIDRVDHRVER
jgi:hypothetical protein